METLATSSRRSHSVQQLDATELSMIPHSKSASALPLPQLSVSELDFSNPPRHNEASAPSGASACTQLRQLTRHFKEETSRAASCSSLSSGIHSTSQQPSTHHRVHNSLRGDSNLKIFLPSDNLALKAILSPKLTPSLFSITVKTSSPSNRIDPSRFRPTLPTPRTLNESMGSVREDERLADAILVMNPNLPPPPFANMYTCESCREDIGSLLSKGRHHCRNCGGSFCATCSSKVICIPYQMYVPQGELRVCDGCFHRIRNFQTQVQSTRITWSGLHPPSLADLATNFDLASDEVPVSIFNCALFRKTTPYYGHLVLTRKRLCFLSYVDAKNLKVAYAKIVSLLKPHFYYINGLELNFNDKKTVFLAEFHGLRDTCFLRLDQLIRAFQDASKLKRSGPEASPSPTLLRQQALARRRSYKLISEHLVAAVATDGSSCTPSLSSSSRLIVDQDGDVPLSSDMSEEDGHTDDGKSTASDEDSFEPVPEDPLFGKMTVLLDCDMRADVKRVFDLLWNDGMGQEFLHSNLKKARDIDIQIDAWQALDKRDRTKFHAVHKGFAISNEDDYTLYRLVRSQHPPKISFPGLPPYAGCTRTQRFRVDKPSNSGDKWDRFVITELNRMSKIPFSDYFEVEMRYVFSRDGNKYCHVQVGLVVNFLKATWFKSQINSSTRSESKEAIEAWAKQAIEHIESQRIRVVPLAPSLGAFSATSHSNIDEAKCGDRTVLEPAITENRPTLARQESPGSKVLNSAGLSGRDIVPSLRALVQWLLLGLLLYGLVLLRIHQTQMQQLTQATTKLLEHLEQQQTRMRQSCEGLSLKSKIAVCGPDDNQAHRLTLMR